MRILIIILLGFASIGLNAQCDTISVNEDIVPLIDCGTLETQCPELFDDENTEYKFDLTCDDGVFLFEVFSSDGNTDNGLKLDLGECLGNPINCDELEDCPIIEKIIANLGDVNDCDDVIDCLPTDLQDGDDVNDADADPTNEIQTLTLTKETKLVGFAGGEVAENGSTEYEFNSTVVRNSLGNYTVTFGSAHPNGNDYTVQLTANSDEPNEDQRKVQFRNKTANGFEVNITVDDNGGTGDIEVDEKFDYTVFEELEFITDVQISN